MLVSLYHARVYLLIENANAFYVHDLRNQSCGACASKQIGMCVHCWEFMYDS